MDHLLVRPTIREALPELAIPDSFTRGTEFGLSTSFTLDGDLAHSPYYGGAYHKQTGDGQLDKELAIRVCDAMFGLRYGEVNRYTSTRCGRGGSEVLPETAQTFSLIADFGGSGLLR